MLPIPINKYNKPKKYIIARNHIGQVYSFITKNLN